MANKRLDPIIRNVYDDPFKNVTRNCWHPVYQQFLHKDKQPAYKLLCSDYDKLMEKVSDMMCEDTSLDILVPYITIMTEDYEFFEDVIIHNLYEEK